MVHSAVGYSVTVVSATKTHRCLPSQSSIIADAPAGSTPTAPDVEVAPVSVTSSLSGNSVNPLTSRNVWIRIVPLALPRGILSVPDGAV